MKMSGVLWLLLYYAGDTMHRVRQVQNYKKDIHLNINHARKTMIVFSIAIVMGDADTINTF